MKKFLAVLTVALLSATLGQILAHTIEWATRYRENHSSLIFGLPLLALLLVKIPHIKTRAALNYTLTPSSEPPGAANRVSPQSYLELLTSLLGADASHFFGASVGREGTAIQLGGAVAKLFSKNAPLSFLATAGISACFASSLGTPFTAALFAIEAPLPGRVQVNRVGPALLGALIGTIVGKISHQTLGLPPVTWPVLDTLQFNSISEALSLLAFLTLALIPLAWLSLIALHRLPHWIRQRTSPWIRAGIGGALLTFLFFQFPYLQRYSGLGWTAHLGAFAAPADLWDPVLKLLLTSVSVTAGFLGGEFVPLFFIGSSAASSLTGYFEGPTDFCAALGAVTLFGACARTPLAMSVLAFEVFGAVTGTLALPVSWAVFLLTPQSGLYGDAPLISPSTRELIRRPWRYFFLR